MTSKVKKESTSKSYVLVADDDDKFLDFFEAIAADYGFTCRRTSNAEEFVEEIDRLTRSTRKEFPTMMFVDMQMEVPDAGLVALRRVRAGARSGIRSVPTVMVSRSLKDTDVCASYKSGANLFIRKNLDPTKTESAIKKVFALWANESFPFCKG